MNSATALNESRYYSGYKRARNLFRKFTPDGLFERCLGCLYSPAKDNLDQLKKHPWLVLLLLKWVFLDDQVAFPGKKAVGPKELKKLLQMMVDMGALARMPSQYDHYILFFRNIAYQQLLYRSTFNINSLARQKILFEDVESNHVLRWRSGSRLASISLVFYPYH
jgi:hypothetical protein